MQAGGQQEMPVAKAVFAKAFAAEGRALWCCMDRAGALRHTRLHPLCFSLLTPRARGSRAVGHRAVAGPAMEEADGGSAGLCCHPTSSP